MTKERTVEFWKEVTYKGEKHVVRLESEVVGQVSHNYHLEKVTVSINPDRAFNTYVYTTEVKAKEGEEKRYIEATEKAFKEFHTRQYETQAAKEFETWDGNFDKSSVEIDECGLHIKGGIITLQAPSIKHWTEHVDSNDKLSLGQIDITINDKKVGELDLTETVLEELKKRQTIIDEKLKSL